MITLITMHELHGLTAQELGELYQLFSMLLAGRPAANFFRKALQQASFPFDIFL